MSGWSSKLIGILAFIVAFVAVMFIKEEFIHERSETKSIQNAQSMMDAKVSQDVSDRATSDKYWDASQDLISSRLKSAGNNNDKAGAMLFSAGVFVGAYGRATVVTPEYCKTLGVDLSEFVNRYKEMHKDVYINSQSVLKTEGSSVEQAFKKLLNNADILEYVIIEVEDMRTMLVQESGDDSYALADACELFNVLSRDEAAMNEVRFSKFAPDAYNILMH